MADYAADLVSTAGSAAATLRTGTASSDTVPAGALVLFNNTGAGSHNVDLAIGATWDGLSPGSSGSPGKRRVVIAAGTWVPVRIRGDMGDANGRVGVTIDGTPTEIKYLVIGA